MAFIYYLTHIHLDFGAVSLLTPCVPTKIVCVGLNYRDHIAESATVVRRRFISCVSSLDDKSWLQAARSASATRGLNGASPSEERGKRWGRAQSRRAVSFSTRPWPGRSGA